MVKIHDLMEIYTVPLATDRRRVDKANCVQSHITYSTLTNKRTNERSLNVTRRTKATFCCP